MEVQFERRVRVGISASGQGRKDETRGTCVRQPVPRNTASGGVVRQDREEGQECPRRVAKGGVSDKGQLRGDGK